MADSDDEEHQEKVIKIAVLGDSGTGKSTLCARFLGQLGSTEPTQGAEIISGQCMAFKTPVNVRFCDVSGQALNSSMLQSYLYESQILLYVYDITNIQSFENLSKWVTRVRMSFGDETKVPMESLFGNKTDLEHHRGVRLTVVQTFASDHLMTSFTGSALTGDMVETSITRLIRSTLGLSDAILCKKRGNTKNGHGHRLTNGQSTSQHIGEPSPLIMNRKSMREITRKSRSNVCSVQ